MNTRELRRLPSRYHRARSISRFKPRPLCAGSRFLYFRSRKGHPFFVATLMRAKFRQTAGVALVDNSDKHSACLPRQASLTGATSSASTCEYGGDVRLRLRRVANDTHTTCWTLTRRPKHYRRAWYLKFGVVMGEESTMSTWRRDTGKP